jgi:GYF domain 2
VNYFIKRDLNEYGPYSLAELQRYVASGNILLTDVCRSEGIQDWVPVSQVIGNIPVPQAAPVASTYISAAPQVSPYPPPPSMHWALVLLIAVVTCGLFGWVWAILQAAWVKKVQPASNGILFWGIAIGLQVVYVALSISQDPGVKAFGGIAELAGVVLWIVGAFSLKSSIEEHFNIAEPMGLQLSGVMTFFFNIYYFQYHFSRIIEIKRSQGQIV